MGTGRWRQQMTSALRSICAHALPYGVETPAELGSGMTSGGNVHAPHVHHSPCREHGLTCNMMALITSDCGAITCRCADR